MGMCESLCMNSTARKSIMKSIDDRHPDDFYDMNFEE